MNERRFKEYNNTFSSIKHESDNITNVFSPQKIGGNLKILAGIDNGFYAISIETEDQDVILTSTELIKVKKVILSNKDMAVVFMLKNEDLLPIFITFAVDLENLIEKNSELTFVQIYNRYLFWQKMFNIEKVKISESTVKGLINELYVLEKLLIPKYGVDKAILGWTGAEKLNKDFSYEDGLWYEAKGISFGKLTVRIASIEQLESSTDGILIVTEFEKTSSGNPNGIRLIDQLQLIRSMIDTDLVDLSLLTKISLLGFALDILTDPNNPVNQYRYVVHETSCYLVDENFPKILREELPNAIGSLSYDVILSEIQGSKIEFR